MRVKVTDWGIPPAYMQAADRAVCQIKCNNVKFTINSFMYHGNVLEMVLKYEFNYVVLQINLINSRSIFVM